MSCTTCTSATSPLIVVRASERKRPEWPPIVRTIILLHEAFQEALEMHRAAVKARPFDAE
jgi:hypothetical protein